MGEGCVQSRHQPRTAHRWWHMHTQAHTHSQLLQRGGWVPVPGHKLPGPREFCFGCVEEAQLGLETLEWEEGRERQGGRLWSHILDLWSVSAVPDLVLWVSL